MDTHFPNDRADIGKKAAVDGFAHELILAGILMKRYLNVSLVDLPLSEYDILVVLKNTNDEEIFIRVQSKTATKSIRFTGGTRGGVDREYKSDVKKYIQSPKTADVVIGVCPTKDGNFDLYIVPTLLIEYFGTESKSLSQLQTLKNNFEMLERSKDYEFILNKEKN
ncbi:hypothetical protein [Raineya orbicola]|jgi:hypothetical protein|uniref:PD(D/E)XK endonuclease domain-containing protein n=1 Tax=Raineya orbicola TaxID=2016530 RepID=A0A2N3I7F5_9BACT|nr:hypothetical protein [Raineya orbicola]PKQ66173.1 hypothetical protein Rain11_2467 [Raineya orbicola]